MPPFVSRAGAKLDHALSAFALEVAGKICADFGCSTGGFTDCLLQRNAAKVYAVDTGYGVLDWKLRKDPRVIVAERTNAMHFTLPETAQIITIDVGWTRQDKILPSARRSLAPGGSVITLLKPHYEAEPQHLRGGVLPESEFEPVIQRVRHHIEQNGWRWIQSVQSPIRGSGGNLELLAWLQIDA